MFVEKRNERMINFLDFFCFLFFVFHTLLTPTHLAIVLEYADEGELFYLIRNVECFNEDEVGFSFI
jgi:hypothetical protein